MTYSGIDPWVGKWRKRWDLITRNIGIKNWLYSWSSYLRMGVSISLLRKIVVICGYIWQQYVIYIYNTGELQFHGNVTGISWEYSGRYAGNCGISEPCMIYYCLMQIYLFYFEPIMVLLCSPHLTSGGIQLQLIS